MTTPMTDFQASVHSLGETTVGYIGKDRVQSLRVLGDEFEGSADIEVCLKEWTWEDREHAITRLIEVQEMFFNEFAISYAFVGPDEIDEPVQRRALDVMAFS